MDFKNYELKTYLFFEKYSTSNNFVKTVENVADNKKTKKKEERVKLYIIKYSVEKVRLSLL